MKLHRIFQLRNRIFCIACTKQNYCRSEKIDLFLLLIWYMCNIEFTNACLSVKSNNACFILVHEMNTLVPDVEDTTTNWLPWTSGHIKSNINVTSIVVKYHNILFPNQCQTNVRSFVQIHNTSLRPYMPLWQHQPLSTLYKNKANVVILQQRIILWVGVISPIPPMLSAKNHSI